MNFVYGLVEIITSFIEIFVIFCIFDSFFDKKCIGTKFYFLRILLTFIVTVLTLWLNTLALYSYLTAVIIVSLISLLSIILHKNSFLQSLCISIVYIVIINALDFLTISIVELIFNVKGVTLEVMTMTGPYRSLLALSMKMILVAAYFLLLRNKHIDIPFNTKFCIIIITSSVFCFFCMQYLIEAVVIGNVADMRRAVLIAWLYIILFVISLILILRDNIRFTSERLENRIVATRLEILEEDNKNLNDAYSDIAKITHDFKNHMLAMTTLAQNEKYGELTEYLSQVTADVDNIQIRSYSGVESIDAVINNKKVKAEKHGIDLKIDVSVLCKLKIRSMDLCAVIVNLLDNAIESTLNSKSKDKQIITFSMSMVHSMVVVKTINYYDESFLCRCGEDKFKTTKDNKQLHGFGMRIVKTLADKYNGSFEIICENGVFVTAVMLSNDN